MDILFVTTNAFPCSGTCTNIYNKIVNEGGLKNISKIDVLCSKSDFRDSQLYQYDNITVFRCMVWSLFSMEYIRQVFRHQPVVAFNGLLQKILIKLDKKLNKEYFLEKPTIKSFERSLNRICASKYDYIVTISGRYEATAAVLKYCKKTNTKFIFYQVDPCETNATKSKASLNDRKTFESELYEKAFAVITTPIIYKEKSKQLSNRNSSKVVPMELPLISPIKIEHDDLKGVFSESGKIKCTFLGNFYGGVRNPEYIIELFKEAAIREIAELHFIGVEKKDLSLYNLPDNVFCHGTVSLSVARQYLLASDFLVNIGNTMTNQVPSKIFEYISTGKPVINTCTSVLCPTIPYFNRYPLSINIYESKEVFDSQTVLLHRFLIDNVQNSENFMDIKNRFQECTPEYWVESFNKLCKVND